MPQPESVDEYVGHIIASIREAVRHAPDPARVAGIGLASIGPLDLKRGGMAKPANLPYEFVALVGPLEEALGIKVHLMNDANAAALGEWTFGAGRTHDNLAYVTISTGIGGGAIVDRHLLIGKDGNAAEIGHVVVDPTGRLTCGCGRKGHWEAYCSGRNLPRLAMMLDQRHWLLQKRLTRLQVAIFEALANIQRSGALYLLTTTFLHRTNVDIETGEFRPINLQAKPFNFPPPIELIEDTCEDLGYWDQRLALWRIADLL
jgi:predicted NBD/HSP70 family sugar kinase